VKPVRKRSIEYYARRFWIQRCEYLVPAKGLPRVLNLNEAFQV